MPRSSRVKASGLPSLPWRPGEVVVHDLFVGDAQFVRCWTRVGEPGRQPHEFYWETYWGALRAGETVTTAAVLHTDADSRPTAYEVWSDRLPLRTVRFEGPVAMVELTDGSTHQVAGPGAADLVLQTNAVGQLALYAASLPSSETEVVTVFFSPEALAFQTLVTTRLARGPDGTTWSTTLGAELVCDHDGRLVKMEVPTQRSQALPVEDNFPDVDRHSLRRPKLCYTPPQELAVEVHDATFERPRGRVGAAVSRPRAGGDAQALPGVLFLQGSGRHDRHGMAPGLDTGIHELVDRLSERGFIALRYDSPGTGTTPYGEIVEAGLDALVDVAEGALTALERHPSVRKGCAVVGHSLGALVALLLAERVGAERVRALALLAPPGRTLDHLMLDQTDRESRRLHLPEEQARRRHDDLRAVFEHVRTEELSESRQALVLGMPHRLLGDLLTTDPAALLLRVAVPVLICQGGKDIQVSATTDTRLLADATDRAGVDVDVRFFPDLDHLFMIEPGTSSPQRYFVRRPIGDALIAALDGWLHRHIAGDNGSQHHVMS